MLPAYTITANSIAIFGAAYYAFKKEGVILHQVPSLLTSITSAALGLIAPAYFSGKIMSFLNIAGFAVTMGLWKVYGDCSFDSVKTSG